MAQDAGAALCYPGRLNGLQAVEADCARIKRPEQAGAFQTHKPFLHRPCSGRWYFYTYFFPIFKEGGEQHDDGKARGKQHLVSGPV